jgi:hypothetical protein
MDDHVHVQSLDHALLVVHQTLEADTDQGLIHLHRDEEEQTIQQLQGEGKRDVQDHHQEDLLEEKKIQNIVAGPIPLAMKVMLLQTGTEMETMRLERNLAMNQRKGVVLEEQFQGRHLDLGLSLWRCLQDEKKLMFKKPHLSDKNFVQLSMGFRFFVSLVAVFGVLKNSSYLWLVKDICLGDAMLLEIVLSLWFSFLLDEICMRKDWLSFSFEKLFKTLMGKVAQSSLV